MIPVSAVGEGNYQIVDGRMVAREGCAPEPYNIDVTMVYTIACILSQWKRADNIKKELLTEQMVEVGRGNTFIGNLFAGLQKVRRPEEKVAGLLNEIEDQDRAIHKLDQHIHGLVSRTGIRDIVQRRRDHLEDM